MQIHQFLIASGSIVLMAACGGGGGGNGDDASADSYSTPHPKALPVSDQDRAAFEKAKTVEYPAYFMDALSRQYSQDVKLNGETVLSLGQRPRSHSVKINAHPLPSGWREYQVAIEKKNTFGQLVETGTGTLRSYQGFHSGVILLNPHESFSVYMFPYGNLNHAFNKLPSSGKARYRGIAFDYADTGELVLDVDFGRKVSYGVITGLEAYGPIALEEARLGLIDFNLPGSGVASMPAIQRTGRYTVSFAGSEAQETLGHVKSGEDIFVAFHGARGEMEK